MPIEIRAATSEEELRAGMHAGESGFASEPHEGELDRHVKTMPHDRFLVAFDNGSRVGTAASYEFDLTIPGGTLPAAGVTWVTVLPSHRRRGILRQFMQHQLKDVHERGEPLAILLASEAVIYGRFGYGIAVPNVRIDADRSRFAYRDDPGPEGAVRLVDSDEALKLFPPIREEFRKQVPGMFALTDEWWKQYRLADPEYWRRGLGPKFYAVYERDGRPEAYAIYRVKHQWEQGFSHSHLHVGDAIALNVTATRELWRFLFGIDLIERVQMYWFDPGSPLFLSVQDPRSLHLRVGDGLWLRLVDVEAALRARSYAVDDSVVLDVRDDVCPWNAGRYRVGSDVSRTDDEPDLSLDVADLASVYLGAFDFAALARAERVRELRSGAVERASALFRTPRPPYCPDEF